MICQLRGEPPYEGIGPACKFIDLYFAEQISFLFKIYGNPATIFKSILTF